MSEVHFDQMRKTTARRIALRGSLLSQQRTSLKEEAAFDADLVAFAPPTSQTTKILASIDVVNEFMAAYALDLMHGDWHESHEIILVTVEEQSFSPDATNQRAMIAEFGCIIAPAANWECIDQQCTVDANHQNAGLTLDVAGPRSECNFARSRKFEAR